METLNNSLPKLTPEETKELKEKKIVYEIFCEMDSDQFSNYQIWQDNFAGEHGDLDTFVERIMFLDENKNPEIGVSNKYNQLHRNALKNINELKTIKFLWNEFWCKFMNKNRTNPSIRVSSEDLFNKKFLIKKSIQLKNKKYLIKELLKKIGIDNFSDYQKIIRENDIKTALMNKARFIQGDVIKKVKSYIPKSYD